ncbi:MAG: hydrogenase nickel incorporation protein HypB [Candidatus Poribacteria bacterium]
MKVSVVENILKANDSIAEQNKKFFKSKGVLTINIMSGPGAGKTSLIEKTINDTSDNLNIAVIEGDIQTTYDADRIAKTGAQVVQINTGGACHLDANMVSQSLDQLELDSVDLLIIENVGNLVCPAEFKLGQDFNITLLSITEGDDKPFKYPLIFNVSHLLLINKIDLLPYIDCDIEKIRDGALRINPDIEILEISCKTGEGLNNWYDWLMRKLENSKETKKYK